MDESVLARMKEVEAAVKKLDPSVRAAAFAMMEEYILSDDGSASSVESVRGGAKRSPASRPCGPRYDRTVCGVNSSRSHPFITRSAGASA